MVAYLAKKACFQAGRLVAQRGIKNAPTRQNARERIEVEKSEITSYNRYPRIFTSQHTCGCKSGCIFKNRGMRARFTSEESS